MTHRKSQLLPFVYDWLREVSYPSLVLQKDPQEESDRVENVSVFGENSLQLISFAVALFLWIVL